MEDFAPPGFKPKVSQLWQALGARGFLIATSIAEEQENL
jgi:hypothetical protein